MDDKCKHTKTCKLYNKGNFTLLEDGSKVFYTYALWCEACRRTYFFPSPLLKSKKIKSSKGVKMWCGHTFATYVRRGISNS